MVRISTYIWLECMIRVGKYFSPMDPMGICYLGKPYKQRSHSEFDLGHPAVVLKKDKLEP